MDVVSKCFMPQEQFIHAASLIIPQVMERKAMKNRGWYELMVGLGIWRDVR
jgi:hypothetical protein